MDDLLECTRTSTHLVMRRQYWLEARPDVLPHAVYGSAVEVALKYRMVLQYVSDIMTVTL